MEHKKHRKRLILITLLISLMVVSTGVIVLADSTSKTINDPVEIYKHYKSNTFPLMTSGTKDLGKFEQIVPGISTALKEFTWSLTRMVGTFNANMVQKMFGLDIISPVKHAMMTIASSLAGSLTTIGSTVGICVVALVMLFRYIASSQFKSAIKVFLTAIMIFVGLAVIADGKTSESLFNKAFEVDQAVNSAIVNVNPVFDHNIDTGGGEATPNGKIQNAGNAMASSIFYANVYEPYLLMNYGTSDQNAIRAKGQVPIGKDKQDRIDGVLDHESMDSKKWDPMVKYEDEKLKNRTIHYKNNWTQMLFSFFYFLVNIIQTAVFFILGLMRLAMALIEVLLIPVLPILLILALFHVLQGVWGNYAKAFGIAIIAKGFIGFAIIMFASYISLGFNIASKNGNIFDKLITIGVYVLAPIFVYFYRKIFVEILTGQFSLSDIPQLVTHPKEVVQKIAKKHADKKQALQGQRNAAKRQTKKQKQAELEQRQKDGNVIAFRQAKPNATHSKKRLDFSPRKEAKKQEESQTKQPTASAQDLQGKGKHQKEAEKQKLDEKKRLQAMQEQKEKETSNDPKKDTKEAKQTAKNDDTNKQTEQEKHAEEAKQIGTRRPRKHNEAQEPAKENGSKEKRETTGKTGQESKGTSDTAGKQPQQKTTHNTSIQHRSDKRNDVKPKQSATSTGNPRTEAGKQPQPRTTNSLQQTKVPSPTRRQAPKMTTPSVTKKAPVAVNPTPTKRSQPTMLMTERQPKGTNRPAKSVLLHEKRPKPQVQKTVRKQNRRSKSHGGNKHQRYDRSDQNKKDR